MDETLCHHPEASKRMKIHGIDDDDDDEKWQLSGDPVRVDGLNALLIKGNVRLLSFNSIELYFLNREEEEEEEEEEEKEQR
ncbi:hypothetical protein PoB_000727300 [Plakobranchus ocellatus]|uniref:Uncharacterized protein n=1 Tax=Plakobranchus ocellatus TaxID=259542 RepID=A0AAV3YF44_9GAST|nr:hypothetical protein PoB_000727300 [Plakobranchus ocellatus]